MTRAKLLMTIVWIWKDLRCQRRILWSLLTVRCDDWGRWRWQEGKKRPVVAFRKRHLFNRIGWLSWFGETLLVCGWNNSIQLSSTFPLPLFAQTSTPDAQKQIKLILHKKNIVDVEYCSTRMMTVQRIVKVKNIKSVGWLGSLRQFRHLSRPPGQVALLAGCCAGTEQWNLYMD